MSTLSSAVFVIHLGATLFMVGLIWFVQIVHYPLHGLVGRAEHGDYHAAHLRRTGPVVGVPMLLEGGSAILLLIISPPAIPAPALWLGLILLVAIWISTAFLQVPCHRRLEHGQDARAHRSLVLTNWFRTLAWSARGVLALWMVVMIL